MCHKKEDQNGKAKLSGRVVLCKVMNKIHAHFSCAYVIHYVSQSHLLEVTFVKV